MAEHSPLEQTAMEAPGTSHGREEKKSVGTLESVLNETGELARKAFDVSLGVGAAALTTLGLGTLNGATSLSTIVDRGRDGIMGPPSFAAGEAVVQGKNFSTKHFRNEMISGSIQTGGIIYPAYAIMNAAQQGIVNAVSATSFAPYATAAGIAGRVIMNFPIYFPVSIAGYYLVDHLVKKRTFKGLYSETIKPNFKKDVKNASKYLALPVLANALLAPATLQVPIAIALTFAYKVMMGWKDKKKTQHSDEPGYLSSAASVTYKAGRNIFYGGGQVLDALIGTTRDWIYKSPPKPAAPEHATVPT